MKMKALAEAIILQSIEDLWDEAHRRESLEFFRGEGFELYAEIAGLKHPEKAKLLRMLDQYLGGEGGGRVVCPVRVHIES